MDKVNRYDNMTHRFDPLQLLVKALALKGVYYPGIWIPTFDATQKVIEGGKYSYMESATSPRMKTLAGSEIRKKDALGRIYFMPVEIKSSLGTLEIPAAAISIKGKKTIIETPLTGRRGSVKELISVDDYEINLHGVIISQDQDYPERVVRKFAALYELNEAVTLVCALSDLVLKPDDKIVIKSVEYPEVGAVENAQIIKMTAVTDSAIELIIE